MKKTILLAAIAISLLSCEKESLQEQCYECRDQSGLEVGTFCGSSEEDAFSKSGTINGYHKIENFRKDCEIKN